MHTRPYLHSDWLRCKVSIKHTHSSSVDAIVVAVASAELLWVRFTDTQHLNQSLRKHFAFYWPEVGQQSGISERLAQCSQPWLARTTGTMFHNHNAKLQSTYSIYLCTV